MTLVLEARPLWFDRAVCRDLPPDAMFPTGADVQEDRVQAFCVDCAARPDCVTYAIEHRLDYGVWGATEVDRRRVLSKRKRYPGVSVYELVVMARGETAAVAN